MIGPVQFFGLMAIVGLPCLGGLIAAAHHRPTWTGLALGAMGFIALVSGWLVMLMVRDRLERKRYPDRIGIGAVTAAVIVLVFAVSLAGSAGLFWWIRAS